MVIFHSVKVYQSVSIKMVVDDMKSHVILNQRKERCVGWSWLKWRQVLREVCMCFQLNPPRDRHIETYLTICLTMIFTPVVQIQFSTKYDHCSWHGWIQLQYLQCRGSGLTPSMSWPMMAKPSPLTSPSCTAGRPGLGRRRSHANCRAKKKGVLPQYPTW